MLKRISAIALALVLSLSCLVIPSFALESSDNQKLNVDADMVQMSVSGKSDTVDGYLEVLPETIVEFPDDEDEADLPDGLALESGVEYIINWNGVEYKCVAQDAFSFLGVPSNLLGNMAGMGGADTGEPFIICCIHPDAVAIVGFGVLVGAFDGSSSVSLSIKQKVADPPMSVLDILGAILAPVWRIFTETPVPGLGISFGDLLLAQVLIGIAIAVLRSVGVGGDGTSYRSGSNRSARISEERKGDEF